jgi:pimeloyl-ACP methyl ester carboxylesterase
VAEIVLIHGTTQSPAGFERLQLSLRARGHQAYAVDLPTDRPALLAGDYAQIIRAQVEPNVIDPVVLAHSGSGPLLPAAAQALHARHQVWLAAAVPDVQSGRSFMDEVHADPTAIMNAEWLGRNPVDDPVLAAYFLFHDCDLATLQWALTTLRLFAPQAAYHELPDSALWSSVPSTYILPSDDRTLLPKWMRQVARERLGVEPIEMPGGHCPHVSRPEQLTDILDALLRQGGE